MVCPPRLSAPRLPGQTRRFRPALLPQGPMPCPAWPLRPPGTESGRRAQRGGTEGQTDPPLSPLAPLGSWGHVDSKSVWPSRDPRVKLRTTEGGRYESSQTLDAGRGRMRPSPRVPCMQGSNHVRSPSSTRIWGPFCPKCQALSGRRAPTGLVVGALLWSMLSVVSEPPACIPPSCSTGAVFRPWYWAAGNETVTHMNPFPPLLDRRDCRPAPSALKSIGWMLQVLASPTGPRGPIPCGVESRTMTGPELGGRTRNGRWARLTIPQIAGTRVHHVRWQGWFEDGSVRNSFKPSTTRLPRYPPKRSWWGRQCAV